MNTWAGKHLGWLSLAAIFSFGVLAPQTASAAAAPSITTPPVSQTVESGVHVVFTVVASGQATLLYQWSLNGTNLTESAHTGGTTSAYLSVNSVTGADMGNYQVTVSNSRGSVTSSNATLTVLLPPAITSQPTNLAAILNSNASFTVTASGTAPLRYQWQQAVGNFYNLNNDGRFSGATSATLSISNIQDYDAWSYRVVVTNSYGSVTSAVATLTVLWPPFIESQPADQTVLVSNQVVISAVAGGTGPFEYQWCFNGTPLTDGVYFSGTKADTLRIWNVRTNDAGNYQLVVSNSLGCVTSSIAALTVHVPPTIVSITTSPVKLGSNANLTVSAAGDGPLFYQWYHNGALTDDGRVSGATTTNLTIANTLESDGGIYEVSVMNNYGTVHGTSNLIVLIPAYIASQPANQAVVFTSNATITVTAGGTAPLAYQWRYNGTNLANGGRFSGANTATLSIANTQTNDAGSYQVLVTNTYGSVTSSVATLTVLLPPIITSQPMSQTVAVGSNVVFTAFATGSQPINYQWYSSGLPLADNARFYGSQMVSMVLSNAHTSDAGNYWVVANSAAGATISSVAMLTVMIPPSITKQPVGRSTPLGLPTTFSVAASGTGPLTYQWRLNGTDIVNATNTSYTIPSVGTIHLGAYQFIVSNAVGTALSGDALLTLGPVAAWGNNTYGQALPPPGLSNVVALAGGSQFSLALKDNGTLVAWGSGTATNLPAGLTNVAFIAAGSRHGLAVLADGTVAAWGSGVETNVPATVSNVISVAGNLFHSLALRREGAVYEWGDRRNYPVPPAGLTNLTQVSDGYGFSLATRGDGSVILWGGSFNGAKLPDDNYIVVPNLTNAVSVAAGFNWGMALKSDGRVFVWGSDTLQSGIPDGLTNVAAIATCGGAYNSGICMGLHSNGIVSAWGSANATVPTTLSNIVAIAAGATHCLALVSDGKPLFIREPVGGTIFPGNQFTLGATVSGQPLMVYSWSFNGSPLAGATNASLVITNVKSSDAGFYQLTASNQLGVATSIAVGVTLVPIPQPTMQSAVRSSSGIFSFNIADILGVLYIVEYRDSLTAGTWLELESRLGNGGTETIQDTNSLPQTRFYRVRAIYPPTP